MQTNILKQSLRGRRIWKNLHRRKDTVCFSQDIHMHIPLLAEFLRVYVHTPLAQRIATALSALNVSSSRKRAAGYAPIASTVHLHRRTHTCATACIHGTRHVQKHALGHVRARAHAEGGTTVENESWDSAACRFVTRVTLRKASLEIFKPS